MLFIAQCEGTGDIHIHRFFLFGFIQLEQVGDLRQQGQTIVFGDDMDEIAYLGVELVTTHLVEGGGLICTRQTRSREHALDGVVLRHLSGQAKHG
ncbi:hypothetical protein D3C84_1070230 [compost metagenome]